MDNTIVQKYSTSGLSTIYFIFFSGDQIVRASDGALLAFSTANWDSCAIAGSDVAVAKWYKATIPTSLPAGVYAIKAFLQVGGARSPVNDTEIGSAYPFVWNGTAQEAAPVAPSTDPALCNCSLVIRDDKGTAVASAKVYFELMSTPDGSGSAYQRSGFSVTADADGQATVLLPRGAKYRYWVKTGYFREDTIPDATTHQLANL